MCAWFFKKRSKVYSGGKKASSKNGAGITGCQHVEESKEIHIYPQCTKLKFKWIKDLNLNLAVFNLIEEKVRNSLKCIDTGDYLLNKNQYYRHWYRTPPSMCCFH